MPVEKLCHSSSDAAKELKQQPEITAEERKLRLLMTLNGPVNAFGTNATDEFQVVRENGEKQGIFKTWAAPVIPFIEADELDVLVMLWPRLISSARLGNTFESSLDALRIDPDENIKRHAKRATEILGQWTASRLTNPYKLNEDLEQARVHSLLIDRRLTEIFAAEPLPTNLTERIGVLVDRYLLAASLEAPFYNLEAIVGDSLGFRWNPVRIAQNHAQDAVIVGGQLDTLAFLLPAAFKDTVHAKSLDWQGLDWEKIKEIQQDVMQDPRKAKILMNISEIASVPIHHIIFAINALEWIPSRVGGKKDDFDQYAALKQIEQLYSNGGGSQLEQIIHIGRDANALIRFLNWMPLVEDSRNFSESALWSYASVCDTAGELLKVATEHPEIWQDNFRDIFNDELLPQLQNLDANSAKGRFLIYLILFENRLKPEFSRSIGTSYRREYYLKKLLAKRDEEKIKTLGSGIAPRMVIGGKAFGLEELINSLPNEYNVPPGIVLTAEAVSDILHADSSIVDLMHQLDSEISVDKKIAIADAITTKIMEFQLPVEFMAKIIKRTRNLGPRLVVRSSSHDEDTSEGITGAGIYESVVNVNETQLEDAIKETIASYFSAKAVQFRHLVGSSDKPRFCLLIQPYIEGIGGVVFTKNLHGDAGNVIIEYASSAADITSAGSKFTKLEYSDGQLVHQEGESQLDEHIIDNLVAMTKKIQSLTGKDLDLEWVVDDLQRIWLLQSRRLPRHEKTSHTKVAEFRLILNLDDSTELMHTKFDEYQGVGDIELVGDRNLEAFQGDLFKIIAKHGRRIGTILHRQEIPLTSHFANICGSFGIKLRRLE